MKKIYQFLVFGGVSFILFLVFLEKIEKYDYLVSDCDIFSSIQLIGTYNNDSDGRGSPYYLRGKLKDSSFKSSFSHAEVYFKNDENVTYVFRHVIYDMENGSFLLDDIKIPYKNYTILFQVNGNAFSCNVIKNYSIEYRFTLLDALLSV